jgi:hypothetical protein
MTGVSWEQGQSQHILGTSLPAVHLGNEIKPVKSWFSVNLGAFWELRNILVHPEIKISPGIMVKWLSAL